MAKNKFKVGDKVVGNAKATERYWLTVEGWTGEVICVTNEGIQVCGKGATFTVDPDCFDFVESKKAAQKKVVITTDGKTTLARLYEGKKVIKRAEAKCCPNDEFDFNVGAELAFGRLMGKEAPSVEWEVVKRKPKKGDYIRLIRKEFSFNKVGDILKVHKREGCLAVVLNKDHPRGGSPNVTEDFEWNYYCGFEVVKPVKVEPVKEKAPEPECYNGKVVCIKSEYDWWTVGKVYEVKDGIITADDGLQYPRLNDYRYKNAEDVRHAGANDGTNYNYRNEFVPLVEG